MAEDINDQEIPVLSVAVVQSTGNGQGFIKFMCETKCQNIKRLCLKQVRKCNSKCQAYQVG